MNKTVEYDIRESLRTVSIESEFNLSEVTSAATRLRSWAMTRGVEIAGTPLLRLTGATTCRVHVPITTETMPHPETGFVLDRCPQGASARLADVRFGEVRAFGRELIAALGASGPESAFEFHSVDGDFVAGDIVVVSEREFAAKPASIALVDGVGREVPEAPLGPARVITVARQHGTGGEAIAADVARHLGFRLVDYGIFQRAAMEARVSPETMEEAAQHRGLFARILDAMSRVPPLHNEGWAPPVDLRASPVYTSAEYRAFVEDSIRDIAEQGNVVILGHGAQLVLAKRKDVLRVLITGSKEHRAQRAIAGGVAPEQADEVIRKADEEREAYFREFYDEGWLDPATYDLVINTDRVPTRLAVQTIVEIATRRASVGGAPAPA